MQALGLGHVLIDDARILAMRHHGQLSRTEDMLQRLLAVSQHVAGTAAHEELDAWHSMRVELCEQVGIGIGRSKEERVVHMAFLRS